MFKPTTMVHCITVHILSHYCHILSMIVNFMLLSQRIYIFIIGDFCIYIPDPATPTVAAPAPMNFAAESISRLTVEVWKLRTAGNCIKMLLIKYH